MPLDDEKKQKLSQAVGLVSDVFEIQRGEVWDLVEEFIRTLNFDVNVSVEVGPKVRVDVRAYKGEKNVAPNPVVLDGSSHVGDSVAGTS